MKKLGIVLSLVLVLLSSHAATASLIVNGGFETGYLTGWTGTGQPSLAVYPYTHTGIYSAIFFSTALNSLSQEITTTNGQGYDLRLYLNMRSGQHDNQFMVQWNGTTLYDQTNIPIVSWIPLSFSVTGTGNDILTFSGRNRGDYTFFDDVSLTATSAVPEPSTYALLCLSLGVVGFARKRMKAP